MCASAFAEDFVGRQSAGPGAGQDRLDGPIQYPDVVTGGLRGALTGVDGPRHVADFAHLTTHDQLLVAPSEDRPLTGKRDDHVHGYVAILRVDVDDSALPAHAPDVDVEARQWEVPVCGPPADVLVLDEAEVGALEAGGAWPHVLDQERHQPVRSREVGGIVLRLRRRGTCWLRVQTRQGWHDDREDHRQYPEHNQAHQHAVPL
jgi:hypothetical protein